MNLAIALASQTLGFIPTIRKLGFMTYAEFQLYKKIEELQSKMERQAEVIRDLEMKNDGLVNLLNTHFALTRGVAS
jgi:NAD-dependent DNA ligase